MAAPADPADTEGLISGVPEPRGRTRVVLAEVARRPPAVTTVKLFGVNLPWLLLGVAAFPFLVAVGWAYVYLAERNEQDFTAVVQRPER